jgi:small GTP-binding protein
VIGRLLGRRAILSEREQDLRAREQELLDRLAGALERFGGDVDGDDLRRFREAREQLTGLFLLIVAGEFNSGKSSFINALLGERVLPEGVTPTTDRITRLRYGSEASEHLLEAFLLDRTIVDTPGTNAIIRRHEELTRDFIPRADLVLFVTSADRPFTESERGFLEQIRQWGKKIVFVVNKIDILATPEERSQVIEFVRQHAIALLGETPRLFAVSAREAQAARWTPTWSARSTRKSASGSSSSTRSTSGCAWPRGTRTSRSSGSSFSRRTSRPSRTSTASSRCSTTRWCATSSPGSRDSTCCWATWSVAACASSRRRSGSAASGP